MTPVFALILVATLVSGGEVAPWTKVDVGLDYPTAAACEADFSRASGMLELILANRYGEDVFHVTSHTCNPKELP